MTKHAFSIYNASAGSGKTYTLVKEYLKIIFSAKNHDAYKNILAITFTNKAVNEMKTRIVENLYAFSLDNPSEKVVDLMKVIGVETGLSLPEIHQKAQSIIKHLIHNYAAFDISTIDKFTHRVIRTFAHDLEIPITFEVSLDTEEILREAVDSIISKAGNDELLTQLLVNFVMEKTDEDKSWDIAREIIDVGKLLRNENNREALTSFESKSIDTFIDLKSKIQSEVQQLEQFNSNKAIQLLHFIENNGIDFASFSSRLFPNHVRSIAENRFNPTSKQYHKAENIGINKNAKDKALIEAHIPYFLSELEVVYKNFEKILLYKAFLKNITPLSLANTINSEFKKIQEERNILSIAEFNQLIFEHIQNQPAPFIYERMGEKYRHFFIDEFQDTSEMQWKNLIPLIDNALAGQADDGTPGSLMLVGDPKQSIYRWRGGKAEQFIELSNLKNPFSNPDLGVKSLDTNYRSYSQIIEFNNAFFKYVSGYFENPEFKKLYQEQSFQHTNPKTGGYVNIRFLPKIDKNESEFDTWDEQDYSEKDFVYIQATYEIILNLETEFKKKQVDTEFQYSDIVILVRTNKDGSVIANFLTEKGIPVISAESLLLATSVENQFLIAFLQYLNNAKNQEAKARFLYYLGKTQTDPSLVHDFMAQGISKKLESDLEQWLSTFGWEINFKNIRKKSLFEIVEWLIDTFIDATKQNAYTQFFLDLVLENETRKQSGINEFLTYWDNNAQKLSIASSEETNAVKIMTIHKSKGLEFPIVILPFVKKGFSKGPNENMWVTADESFLNLPKVLVGKSSKIEHYGKLPAQEYLDKKEEDRLDEINVLYVAFTRAEEQLYIISQHETRAKTSQKYPNSQSSFLIEFLENQNLYTPEKSIYEFGNAARISNKKHGMLSTKNIPILAQKLPFKNIKIAQKESLMWNTQQQKAIEYGNIIHEILSFVTTKDTIDWALTLAVEKGLIQQLQQNEIKETLEKIVYNEALKAYFEDDAVILNEQIILQKEGSIVKPDRMVIKNNQELYLLDYKTGAHQSKYETQLNDYQQAIEKIGYRVTKKNLVYIGEAIEIVTL